MNEFRKTASDTHVSLLSGGKFALGVMVGFGFFVFIYLFSPSTLLSGVDGFLGELVATLPTLIIAAVALFISREALVEQRRMRQAGTDPVVLAHISQNPQTPLLVELSFTNVGAGAAMNLNVIVDKPSNADDLNLWGKPFELAVLQGKKAVGVLLQGKTLSYTIAMGFEVVGSSPLAPFNVQLKYQDIEGNNYETVHLIDVTELSGMSATEPAQTKIWRELEKIQKSLAKLRS